MIKKINTLVAVVTVILIIVAILPLSGSAQKSSEGGHYLPPALRKEFRIIEKGSYPASLMVRILALMRALEH